MSEALLDIRGLSVQIRGRRRTVQALSDVDLHVDHGEVVGLVGESGGGKTMIARTIVAALPRGARATGSVRVAGRDVLALTGEQLADHRGHGAAMCFQNPRRALAPVRTIGRQLTDRLAVHQGLRGDAARAEAVALLRQVGLRDAVRRLDAYPHELSGGMSQRVMIATALACRPRLLLADEPTTGLDVTLTRDILELFRAIADEQDRGVLLVSHDIASIAEFCDRLVVLYAGSVVETGPTADVLTRPVHPYTRTLLDAVPDLDGRAVRATTGLDAPARRRPHGVPVRPALQPRRRDVRDRPPRTRAGRDGSRGFLLPSARRLARACSRGRTEGRRRQASGPRRRASCAFPTSACATPDASAPRPATRSRASASPSAAARRSASSARAAAARRRSPA